MDVMYKILETVKSISNFSTCKITKVQFVPEKSDQNKKIGNLLGRT